MDLVFSHVRDVKMSFPQPLEVTEIIVADDVALSKGRSLEFPGTDLRDVMGQGAPNGLFEGDDLQHGRFSCVFLRNT